MYRNRIEEATANADKHISVLSDEILSIEGFSSSKVRHLLSNLVNDGDIYLEIGVCMGSTFISSLYKKNDIISYVIDNWSMDFKEDLFLENVSKYLKCNPTIISEDSFSVDLIKHNLNNINIYFYDGDHEGESQYLAITHYYPALSDDFILIIDDYSWDRVMKGTQRAIKDLKLNIIYEKVLPGNNDSYVDYWNGVYVAHLKK